MKRRVTSVIVFSAMVGAAASSAAGQTSVGEDRVLWRVQMPGPECWRQFVIVGPDGTIYTSDRVGTYAVRPDGSVKWFTTEMRGSDGMGRPISVGPDGTVYGTGGIIGNQAVAVVALNPEDGSVRWRYIAPNGNGIDVGPNVGPNGNIYGVQEADPNPGLGAFALDPDGNLLWSNEGNPVFTSLQVIGNSNIAFGPDRVYASAWFPRSGQAVLYAFDADGHQQWTSWDLDHTGVTFPHVDQLGRVITGWGQTGVRAITPDGEQEWFAVHPNQPAVNRPTIDSRGNSYIGNSFGLRLWSVDPDDSTRWLLSNDFPNGIDEMGVTPDDALLIGGGDGGFSEPGWVRAYSTADGSLVWQVDLPDELGFTQYTSCLEPAFSADSRTAYFTTQFGAGGTGYGYLIAIRTGESCVADFDGDGDADGIDVGLFLQAYGTQNPAADVNGDGIIDGIDVGLFLQAHAAGC